MHYETLKVEREGHLLLVTIDRPKALNAFSTKANFELDTVFNEFEKDSDLRVAILTATGEKAFSVGGDVKEMAASSAGGEAYQTPESGMAGITNRFTCFKPIIAAVNGMALGGGFEAAIACDLVVASEHATFGLPEPKIGVVATAGGMFRLPQEIGLKRAQELLFTAEPISAQKAMEWGIINEVVPKEALMKTARELADKILKNAPLAVQATKQCIAKGMSLDSVETAINAQTGDTYPLLEKVKSSKDIIEGITAFAEKRAPQWKAE